jgi:hypothetical protein
VEKEVKEMGFKHWKRLTLERDKCKTLVEEAKAYTGP